MYSQNLWSCALISLNVILIFLENFLYFRLNMIEKQRIINLSSNCSKNYDCRSWWFQGHLFEGRKGFSLLSIYILFLHTIAWSIKKVVIFPSLPYFSLSFLEVSRFPAFLLFNTESSSFSINCPSLISSWRTYNFFCRMSDDSVGFQNKLLKCSFYSWNFSS